MNQTEKRCMGSENLFLNAVFKSVHFAFEKFSLFCFFSAIKDLNGIFSCECKLKTAVERLEQIVVV
jgi:hypothetical protein